MARKIRLQTFADLFLWGKMHMWCDSYYQALVYSHRSRIENPGRVENAGNLSFTPDQQKACLIEPGTRITYGTSDHNRTSSETGMACTVFSNSKY